MLNMIRMLQTRFLVWRLRVLPSGLAKSADDLWAFAIDMAVAVPSTFAVAYISYQLIERPATRAARRLEHLFCGSFDESVSTNNKSKKE